MNKIYIKIALALLSVAGYMQNIAFASEYAPSVNSSTEVKEYIFIEPDEAEQAEYIMDEALDLVQQHAKHTDDYELYYKEDEGAIIYFKSVNGTEIGKLELTIPNPDSYSDIVNMLWDPNGAKNFDNSFVNGKFSRIYNKNLVIRQQRYEGLVKLWHVYYYALASKYELSEDTTVIVLASSNVNDGDNRTFETYVNPIVKSARSFNPEVHSEEDIKIGRLYKTYINLVGFIIKKEDDCVKITNISSIDHCLLPDTPEKAIRKLTAKRMLNMINLRDIF
ncbi:hypothetical protein YYC_02391 [Plasmodium yoelii 17X]|uniref:Fam-a protein n=1 Tax=Plasmodium yoelii 17X TaxID=1323249 RepID=V7PNS9_PLAYE|nr:hypothetical protein YYC_02391 [Plasmodium yoelii 17X]